jgi:hypothetical protein
VSNFHDPEFRRCGSIAREFTIARHVLQRDRRFCLVSVGAPFPATNDLPAINSLLRSYTKRGVRRHLIINLLCNLVRHASRLSSTVGRGMLVVVLPKTCVNATEFVVAGGESEQGAWSFHVPSDSCQLVQYAPHVVYGTSGSCDIVVEYCPNEIRRVVAALDAAYVNPNSHRARYLTCWERVHCPDAPSGVGNELSAAQVNGAPEGSTCTDLTGLSGHHIPPSPNVVLCEYESVPLFLDRIERESDAVELSRRLIQRESEAIADQRQQPGEMSAETSGRIREWLRSRGVDELDVSRLLDPRATCEEIESRLLNWTRRLRKPGAVDPMPRPPGNTVSVPGRNAWGNE